MASTRHGNLVGPWERLFVRGTVASLSEGQLLERFVHTRDESAFEALVTRHGPMVLGVCRRGLDDPNDAEDAFQATFLVLVRKARSLRDADHLGPWLFGVARRVSTRARVQSSRRREREQSGAEAEAVSHSPSDEGERHELKRVLDDEIARLPVKYRAPVVLCYLEGLTHEEAALRLGCPVGTVRSRMAWARERLRQRLDRRGLAPAGLLAFPRLVQVVPAGLTESTLNAAGCAVAGTLSKSVPSAAAAALAQGVTHSMFLHKLTITASVLATAGLVTGGAVLARQDRPALATPVSADDIKTSRPASSAEGLQERNAALERQIQDLRQQVERLTKSLERFGQDAAGETQQRTRAQMTSADVARANVPFPDASTTVDLPTTVVPADALPRPASSDPTSYAVPSLNAPAARPTGAIVTDSSISLPARTVYTPAQPSVTNLPSDPAITTTTPNPATSDPFQPGQVSAVPAAIPAKLADDREASSRKSNTPFILESGGVVTVLSPGRDRALAKRSGGEWRLYRAPQGVTIVPILHGDSVVLQPEGTNIPELAVFDPGSTAWATYRVNPAASKVQTVLRNGVAQFIIGSRVIAYSFPAAKWDVLETHGKTISSTTALGSGYQDDDGLHVFDTDKGRWQKIDWESLEKQAKDPKDQPDPANTLPSSER